MMKALRQNGLYVLERKSCLKPSAFHVHNQADKTRLWHARSGHISQRGLVELYKLGVFGKDQISKLDFCEQCVLGKQNRVKFQKAIHRTKGTLDYIHRGSCYFITFINDYSRRVWLYIMKHNNEALKKFTDWKALVENQTRKKIKRLGTDNDLEYLNHEFS